MGKLVHFNMMSIDGFFEGKNKELDWHQVDNEFNEFAIEQLNSADLLIFGRSTYELMVNYWPTSEARSDDPAVARKMNTMSKVVFSKTLGKVNWDHTQHYTDPVERVIPELKKKYDRDLLLLGSANLAISLMRWKLIDEFRIMINPVVLGGGNPLFSQIPGRLKFNLVKTRTFKSGNILLYYQPVYWV